MKKDTLKKLGLCEAYEYLFGGDEFNTMRSITEKSDEYDEWQEDLDNPEIKKYKDKMLAFFNELE